MALFQPLTGLALFQSMVEQYSTESATPANTDEGSTLGAIFEAAVLLSLQLQQQIVYLFQVSRIATSYGLDLDTAVNPFGVFRLGPNQASGIVTATYPAGPAQTIQVGAVVQTQGGVLFEVIADPNNTTGDYDSGLNGYQNNPVVTIIVQCTQTGLIGNVLPNTITLPYTGSGIAPIPGSPAITNPSAFINAVATETDDQLKARFASYISGGGNSSCDEEAIKAAIAGFIPQSQSIPSGAAITYSYGDLWSYSPTGTPALEPNVPGWFTIIAAQANSGSIPPSGLAPALKAAILPVRAGGIMFAVIPPVIKEVDVIGKVVVSQGYSQFVVIPAVTAAYIAYVNGIGLDPDGGATVCSPFGVYVALSKVPGVERIDGLVLNNGLQDIFAPFGDMFSAGTTDFSWEMVC